MAIDIYLNFNGNTREVVEFYAEVFGTEKPEIMTFGQTPPNPEYPLPEEAKDLVMHTRLNISGSNIMFSDIFPGFPYIEGNNFYLSFLSEDIDELKSVFNKLSDGGKVTMELQETFWSKCYGSLTDKFGTQWMFNHGNGGM
ncbi:VOC family protein [Bacillus sp. EAC]|uniref:VOC family protein n=1 Tax=Bacillus sp. EAC TaxID=1978338 RepID=UPI000B43AC06|nr:VOC family protein [Bacillus sp. EAC]